MLPLGVNFFHSNVNDDQSTLTGTTLWSYESEDDFNLDDWPEDATTMSAPLVTRKRVSWDDELEFPRYFNKDDCPLAAGRDAPISNISSSNEKEEDVFGQQYMVILYNIYYKSVHHKGIIFNF